MTIFGLLRIKNEQRWISRVIRSIQPVCERILVLDDHSTDGTPEICEELGCTVYRSEFEGLSESRDKDYLLQKVWEIAQPCDCCVMVDGDEAINAPDIPALLAAAQSGGTCWSFHVIYLWDREDQIRVDRWYAEFRRPSMFRLTDRSLSFRRTDYGGNMHCSSAPAQLLGHQIPVSVRLIHFGYLHREDRIRKYHWYNSVDPNNPIEDGYRHIVCGDIAEVPATMRTRWAGPLELRSL